MMATINLTDEQIRIRGLEALNRELGPAGMIRFLRQFELGHGDYSKDRHEWLKSETLEDLLDELHNPRNDKR